VKHWALALAVQTARRPRLRRIGDRVVEATRRWRRGQRLARRIRGLWCRGNLAAGLSARRRIIRLRSGVLFNIALQEPVELDLFIEGEIDPEVSRLLPRLVRPGATVLDIGANLGYYTCLLAALVGPRGRVIAFEPNAAIAARLWASVVRNGFQDRVCLVRAAVADRVGTITFFPSPDPHNSAISAVLRHPHLAASRPVEVPATTVDAYLEEAQIAHVDFIKMDVECAEILVLAGMARLLATAPPPCIISEVTESPAQLVSGRELIGAFAASGYRAYDIGITGLMPTDSAREGFAIENLCFVHKDAARLITVDPRAADGSRR
jgi:FkbM family methyltransferase